MRCMNILFILFGASLALPVQQASLPVPPSEQENVLKRAYEDRLNKTVECIKTLCIKGKPEIGLPSYDPLILKDIFVDLNDLFGLSAIQGNMSLKSIKFFDVIKFNLVTIEATNIENPDVLKFHIIAEWPVYGFEGQYDINMVVKENTIKGKGSVREALKKFRYDINFQTALPLHTENFNVALSVDAIEFHADEMIINGENVTDEINKSANKAAEWVKENSDVINESITRIMLKIINNAYIHRKFNKDVIAEYRKCWNEAA